MRLRPLFLAVAAGIALVALGASALPGAEPPARALSPASEQARFFETNIRPVLVSRCQKCHGPELQRGSLRLDSGAALLKGGAKGKVVVPGQPDQSSLIAAISHTGNAARMPPGGKLSGAEIAAFRAWIASGAAWPAVLKDQGGRMKDEGGHWAFRPVQKPLVPAVKQSAWVKTPVDAFILSALEKKGLKPASPADRRTLIRRATFDLTGLPPTPEEVEAFVNDKSANAWEKVVERLLASPHYGEKWGRHWLDVARYSDSNGMDENVHYGNAWRFRDYVVSSFNKDKPFDRFVVEQIAGDLLPKTEDVALRNERLVATGFFSIGPKLISEVDDRKMEMDTIDEQVDTLGRTFMGLTLGCARCHDHKFDPVSTKDYYALAGIFKSTKTMEIMKKPRMWYEHSLATEAEIAAAAEHKKKLDAQKQAVSAAMAREAGKLTPPAKTLTKALEEKLPAEAKAELQKLREELAQLEKAAPQLPMAMGVTEREPTDVAVHIRGEFLNLGEIVPRRFPTVLVGSAPPPIDRTHSGRLELAKWLVSPEHPLTRRVAANRIWRWHFGRGVVPSTDNFGLLGDLPTNPGLLDYLATRFAEDGWSFKRMHRLIMLSSTYRMSSAFDAKSAQVDPENRLQWRWEPRRLQAEEIRDAVLAVSGTLDETMGGSILPLKNREYVFDHTSKDNTRYDTKRRSLYIPVIRNNLYDVFRLFDFGDGQIPEGSRPTTTVAPQALFMMNSDLVADSAEALGESVMKRTDLDTDGRIRLLYQKTYARPATPAEAARGRTLLERFQKAQPAGDQRDRNAWAWLSQVTMSANEFIYVR
jgi:hypothetical protein